MADNLIVNIDVNSSQALSAMSELNKANVRYQASAIKAAEAQAKLDAALAKSGTGSAEAVAMEKKLEAANLKLAASADKVAIATARSAEVQAAASKKAAVAADTAAAANKKRTASLVQSTTGFSVAQTGALAAGAAFLYAAKSAADFDAKMAQVRTLTGGSAAQMSALSDATKQFADIGISASQAADAEIELVKAGVSVKDILGGGLSGALNLAAAGQLNVADATTIASAAMVQFGLSGKDIPHIADDLAAGANKSLGSVQDLGEGLKAVGTSAHQAGFSLDETVGALAELASAGLTAEMGGTALKQMFLKLEAPSAKAKSLMDQYRISLYDASGNVKPFVDIVGELHTHLQNLTPATRNAALATIFGSRAVQAANVFYKDGAKVAGDWGDKVHDAGAAARTTKGQLDSLSGDFTKLKASLQNLAVNQGEGAQSPLRSLTQELTSLVDVANSPGVGTALSVIGKINKYATPVGWGQQALKFAKGAGGDDITKQIAQVSSQTRLLQQAIARQREIGAGGGFQPGAMDDLGTSFGVKAAQVSGVPRALGQSVDDLGNSFGDVAPKAAAAGAGVSGFGSDASAAKAKTDALGFSLKELTTALKNDEAALSHRAAMRDYADAIKAVDQQQKKAHTSTQKMNETLDSQAAAALNAASTMKKGSQQQIDYLNQARDALYRQARQFGMTRDEADKYVNSVLHIPGQANTHVNLYSEEAQAKIDHLLASYNALRSKTVVINYDIRQSGTDSPGGHTVYGDSPGSLPGHAGGGAIGGRGTGTSDSNIIRASKGEHMWTARETANAGGHAGVMALRRQFSSPRATQALARGGSVGSGSSSAHGLYMTDPALVSEVRGLRSDLASVQQKVLVTNAGEVATGVQTVADARVNNNSQHDARRKRAGW